MVLRLLHVLDRDDIDAENIVVTYFPKLVGHVHDIVNGNA